MTIVTKRCNEKEAGHLVAASVFSAPALRRALLAATSLVSVVWASEIRAEAYIPTDDTAVLEKVQPATSQAAREIAALAAQARRAPGDFRAAANLIRRYIQEARTQGDPRYAGYAEAALAPWLGERTPAMAVVLRATLRQYNHDFSGALADLDLVLKANPGDAQARLTRAIVHQVKANYAQARADCDALRGRTIELVQTVCSASVSALSGNADSAYASLREALERAEDNIPAALRAWAVQTMGNIATRRGRAEEAEKHYRAAIVQDGPSLSLTCDLADLMLAQGRAEEARDIIGDDLRPDLLLLRRAEAAHAMGEAAFDGFARDLDARFAASAARGDNRHLREEARFRLLMPGEARRALVLAQRNWQIQHEPEDARVLLAAALAANDNDAAQPVIAWVQDSKLEDAAIAALIGKLKKAGS